MSHSLIEDTELLARAVRGDEAAFRALYERHRVAVYRFAYRMCSGGASDDAASAAEDVTHDCFVGLIKNPHHFDPNRADLRAYLYGAARNLALKRRRRRGAETPLDETGDRMPAAGGGREDASGQLESLLEKELSQIVERAVNELPPLQREVLLLSEYEDLPLAAVAGIVGADLGTVKARLWRARQGLRAALAPYLERGARPDERRARRRPEELVTHEQHHASHARPRE